MNTLDPQKALVVLVDIQENHFKTTFDGPETLDRGMRFLKAAQVLGVPMLWTEQYPKAFGPTLAPLRELMAAGAPGLEPIAKTSFGCFGEPAFEKAFNDIGRPVLYLVGSETHICIGQTALQALDRGIEVVLVADCVNARGRQDHALGIERLRRAGVIVTTWEAVIYEWMGGAKHPAFKAILPIVKG